MTQHESSKLDLLREQILNGQLSRRAVLKRAMVMGLSAPVIAGLLAACGDDDDDGDDAPEATATTAGAAQPTAAEQEATEAPDAEETEAPEAEATEAPDAAEPTATTAAAPPAEAGGGGLIRLLWWQAPTILNSHLAQGTKDYDASGLMLESLANVAADGSLVPRLAAEIPSLENGGVAEDGLSVTWKLREGVIWHDGEAVHSRRCRLHLLIPHRRGNDRDDVRDLRHRSSRSKPSMT